MKIKQPDPGIPGPGCSFLLKWDVPYSTAQNNPMQSAESADRASAGIFSGGGSVKCRAAAYRELEGSGRNRCLPAESKEDEDR